MFTIRRISGCACCSSRSSSTYIIWFYSASWRTTKSSSIWPESGLKRRSPGSKKHMLIRSIDVRIRTRRTPFWSSSVLAEQLQVKIHEQKFEEMEWSSGPIGSRANILYLLVYTNMKCKMIQSFFVLKYFFH